MGDAHDVDKWVKIYMRVGAALMVLTVVTVAVSYVPFGVGMGIVVALLIAMLKGSLVCGFFMHLIEEKPMITWILVLTVFFFFFLLLMPLFWSMDTVALPGN